MLLKRAAFVGLSGCFGTSTLLALACVEPVLVPGLPQAFFVGKLLESATLTLFAPSFRKMSSFLTR
jgi:hypothetical protein